MCSAYRMNMPSFNYKTGCNEEDKANFFHVCVRRNSSNGILGYVLENTRAKQK